MYPHCIMFHHFHDDALHSVQSQGSISRETLIALLDRLQERHTVLNPEEWESRLFEGTLRANDTCLTFDDSLKCQFDVARPVLESLGLRAYWFVYTSPLEGVLEKLEIYRYFRSSRFNDLDDFYAAFFELCKENEALLGKRFEEVDAEFARSGFLAAFAFYTTGDRRFRYFRDVVLGPDKYTTLMDSMLARYEFDARIWRDRLWMSGDDIRRLADSGHVIGLHSHTHPTAMKNLPRERQLDEYARNQDILRGLTGRSPSCVSYPCGSYNDETSEIMAELGVTTGFDSFMHEPSVALHVPRQDHANLLAAMRREER